MAVGVGLRVGHAGHARPRREVGAYAVAVHLAYRRTRADVHADQGSSHDTTRTRRRDGRRRARGRSRGARTHAERDRSAPDAGVGARAAQRHLALAAGDHAVRRPTRDDDRRDLRGARRPPHPRTDRKRDGTGGDVRSLRGRATSPRSTRRARERSSSSIRGPAPPTSSRASPRRFGSTACPPGRSDVDVWLPHAAAVRLIELRANGTVTAADDGPTAVGPLRQLHLALPRSDAPDRRVACGRGSPRGRRSAELRVRRSMSARSVRGPDDRRASGRPDQREARDQHRQRRHHARAHVRPGRPRLARHHPRTPSRCSRCVDHADHVSGRRGSPGTDR